MLVCAAFFFSLGLRRAESTIYSLALGSGLVLSLLHPVIAVSFFVCNLLLRPWEVRDGHIELPDGPGLGVEVDEREAERHRAYVEELGGEFTHPSDGSVADW